MCGISVSLMDSSGFVEEAYCDDKGPLVDKHVGIDGLGKYVTPPESKGFMDYSSTS